jgi:large subunit ribosomal protein L17
MKKRVVGRKLSRDSSSRKALLRSLARALMSYGKIDTTFAKAKFAQKFVERLLSQAQDKSLSARRRILAELGNDRFTLSRAKGRAVLPE